MNVLDYVLQIGVSVIISAILVYFLSWTIVKFLKNYSTYADMGMIMHNYLI
ncbi:hypothetical protein [uncultured Methanobrevibacter sp.]|uniref:hypothetical protein n=1 Tax=uncultured Methanobrevibacter sp. TaxID=253161 RepID=UPI0025F31D89|nr:hypothetical protein [uncultured Methanobrevibacter sp.]MEE3491100.1 hypothetical protein [Methanobrevibacter sp.]